ncbi:MAG: RHS repeat-associated core domain-containing protein [Oscillospiraceae bacterium]
MKSHFLRSLAVFLTLAMLIQLLPVQVLAVDEDEFTPEDVVLSEESEDIIAPFEELAAEESMPADISFEVEALREENIKQFRMNDGSYIAVQYATPVHYEDENGQWQDIDNTLYFDSVNTAKVYSARNGQEYLSFAANLQGGDLFSTSFGDYSVHLSLFGTSADAEEDVTQTTSPEDSTLNPETSESASVSEATEPMPKQGVSEITTPTTTEDASYSVTQSDAVFAEKALQFHGAVEAQIQDGSEAMSVSTEAETSFLPDTLSSSLLYENVYDSVDLKYEVFGYNIKESIIVNQPRDCYEFSFVMQLDGLMPIMQEDGSILLVDDEQTPIYIIPAPYMIDSSNTYSDAAAYTLDNLADGKYLLCVEADAEWMNTAQFPVAIDPTIFKLQSSNPLSWSYIFSGNPATTYSGTSHYIGYTALNNGGEYQIITHINTLPSLPAGSVVTNAAINVRHSTFSNDSSANYMMMEAHRLTIDKSSGQTYDNWLKNMTWNNVHPGGATNYNSRIEDFTKLTSSTTRTYIALDLTRAVRDWYQNGTQNRTLLLKSDCSSSKRIASTLYTSASNTYFAVTYRNDFGLEDYYTYQTQSAGRAGTGYVSDHMQRLTIENPIITSDSNVMPFSLSLVYNSALNNSYFGSSSDSYTRDFQNMILGGGWKLSAQQCIQSVRIAEDDTNTLYWVYTDGDGTQHYFYETSSGVYEDEDGLGLKITLVSETGHTNFKMTDDYGNETFFRDGILTYTKDAYGNGIYYCYNYSTFNGAASTTWRPTNAVHNQLTSIWRLNNGGSSEQLARFVYDSNNNITGVYDEAGRETLFYYNTSGGIRYLDYVVYPDGAKADYTYNTYGMTCAYDQEANYGICYTYDSDGTVNQFYEYYLSGTTHVIGNIVSCWNGLNRSSYRDWGADHKKETSDDLRQEVLFDNWGRTVCTYTTNTDSTEVLGSSAASYVQNSGTSRKNNRTLDIGSSGMTAVNLLIDGGIEKSTDSWTSSCSANASAAARTTITNDENRRHGTGGLNLYLSSSATSSNYAGIYRSASLTGGKPYTLSAYFSASSYMNWNSGAKLELLVQNSSGTTLETHLLTDAKPNAAMEDGWQRVSATYTPAGSGNYRFLFKLSGCNGTAYLDDLQLEQAEAASTYNLLQNGSFENTLSGNWSINGMSKSSLTTTLKPFGTSGVKVTGSQNAIRRASQTITLNCSSDTTFLLSGWALAEYAAPNSVREYEWGKRYFGLIAEIIYTDTSTAETQSVPFEWSSTDWQCSVGTIVPKRSGKTVKNIHIYCAYDYNSGTAWFDNISLRQEPVQTYRYDEKGNVTAATQTGTGTENAQYDSNGVDLLQYTAANGTKYSYEYNNAHDVTKTTVGSLTATTSYNKSGNTTGARLVGKDSNGNASLALQSSATPTADRNHTSSVTDANGSTTSYTYNGQTELLATSTNAAGRQTTYEYYLSSGRAKSTYQSGVAAIGYTYSGGRLSQLDRKTYRSGAAQHQYYNFAYNVWGQTTATKVGSRTLSTNTYYNYVNDDTARGGNLKSTTYANGDSVSYTYDRFDRLVRKSYNSGSYVAYAYNAEGSLARLSYGDSTGELASYRFEYDSLGRLIRSAELDADGGTVQRTEHIYDGYNRLSRQSWTLGGKTYTEYYSYDDATDGSMTSFRTTAEQTLHFTYDALRRLQKTTVTDGSGTLFTVARSYYTTGGKATTRTEYFNYRMPNGSLIAGDRYVYDALGNITELQEAELASGSSARRTKVRYTYDGQNQLRTETRYTYSSNTDTTGTSVTYTYNYDTAGNLQSVQKNGATVQTYTYGDSQWRDLLTKVGGTTISYDASGNPKNWYNGTTYTGLTWKNGRQLAQITTGGRTSAYRYDADGIRTYKKVGSVAHEYRTLNGKVVYEKIGSGSTAKIMIFSYDAQGRPFAVKYSTNNGGSYITYFYALNQQGDVVKIFRSLPSRDSNGNLNGLTEAVYATYTYDAWGNILSQSGSMASTNPLRYRGYYYDSETGFYYLQSRYYDPATRRFINADVYSSTDSSDAVSCNMFAYCGNNPTSRSDETGDFWNFIVGAVVGAVVNAVSTAVDAVKEGGLDALSDGKTWAKIGVSAAGGLVSGALAASGVGLGASILGNTAISMAQNAANQAIDNGGLKSFDVGDMVIDGFIGGISAIPGGKGMKNTVKLDTLNKRLTKKVIFRFGASC